MFNEYKNISGIYCIENKINGKKYVGKSYNLKRRMSEHLRNLRKNKDSCKLLQNAWNKYGEENFVFWVVEECCKDNLNEREICWIKDLDTFVSNGGNGYNLSTGGDGSSGSKRTKEYLDNLIGKYKGVNSPIYGTHISEEHKKSISNANKGRANPYKGQKIPDERRKNILIAIKDRSYESNKIRGIEKIGKKEENSSSKYRGVCLNKNNKWSLYVPIDGRQMYLGSFSYEIEAALAWNEAILDIYGPKFADRLNIITPEEIENLWNQE